MATPNTDPGNHTITRNFYDAVLEEAGGDIREAVASISDKVSAYAFAEGYIEKRAEGRSAVDDPPHKLVVLSIFGHLADLHSGDPEALHASHVLWEPAFDIIKLKNELGSRWNVLRDAVHFDDAAGEKLLFSDFS